MIHDKHFTLLEAQEQLIVIKPYLRKIIELKEFLDDIGFDVYNHEYFGGRGPNGTGAFPKEMDELVSYVKKIADKGILIKDLNSGLIDFPFVRESGEEVYLCYIYGEEKILFWHSIPDGFKGRRSIEEL
jgi:hypothetical protein